MTHAAVTCQGTHLNQSLHVWRLDFSVVNGSDRRLESLTAHVRISSVKPTCRWDGQLAPRAAFEHLKPVLWGDSLQELQAPSGMSPGEELPDAVFVLASYDGRPVFENGEVNYRFATPSCSEPFPLWCSKGGAVRLDPVIAMPTGRYTFDNNPDPGEIDPFGSGTFDLDVQLAGIEIAHVLLQDKIRYGLNGGFGITKHEGCGADGWVSFWLLSGRRRLSVRFRMDACEVRPHRAPRERAHG